MTDEAEERKKREEEAERRRVQLLAFRFASQEADPGLAKRQHEMDRDEIRGEMLGSAVLEAHAAYVARKQGQGRHFADLLSEISDKEARKA
jgi:hypothetical protein